MDTEVAVVVATMLVLHSEAIGEKTTMIDLTTHAEVASSMAMSREVVTDAEAVETAVATDLREVREEAAAEATVARDLLDRTMIEKSALTELKDLTDLPDVRDMMVPLKEKRDAAENAEYSVAPEAATVEAEVGLDPSEVLILSLLTQAELM